MNINPKELAKRPESKKLIVYLEKFEVPEDAPMELKSLYRPTVGKVYKAIKDTNTGFIFIDVPETFERDRGGWGFSGLESNEGEEFIFKLVEVTSENIYNLKLDNEDEEKLIKWMKEKPLRLSWEKKQTRKSTAKQPKAEVTPEEDSEPASLEEWINAITTGDIEGLIGESMGTLKEYNPEIFSALVSTMITFALQENNYITRLANNDKALLNPKHSNAIPLAMSSLLNSYTNYPTIPILVEIIRLGLLETTKLMEKGTVETLLLQLKNKK